MAIGKTCPTLVLVPGVSFLVHFYPNMKFKFEKFWRSPLSIDQFFKKLQYSNFAIATYLKIKLSCVVIAIDAHKTELCYLRNCVFFTIAIHFTTLNSANTSSMVSDTEKIKTISTTNSLKRPRGSKEHRKNSLKKFIGKKKKYKNMSETEILKEYYLNHCGLCNIKFKDLDENLKLGMVQNSW